MSKIAFKLQQACALHQQGQLARARSLFEEVLALYPRHPGALSSLGMIAGQTGSFAHAAELLKRAVQADPTNPAAFNNHGLALHELGQWETALESYDKAIAVQPRYAVAHYNRANTLARLKRWTEALSGYDKAIAFDPRLTGAQFNRGLALAELKRFDAALDSYDKAIAMQPEHAEAHSNRGNVLAELTRWPEAVASYGRAIGCRPDYPEAWSNRGNALEKLGRLDEALASYDQAIALKPDYDQAHYNRGNALKAAKRWDDALASYERAIACNAAFAKAHFNKGVVLQERGDRTAALASYETALAVQNDYAEVYCNRGNVQKELGELEAALESYDRALEIEPDYADVHTNKSLLSLLRGDFANGWTEYEWRWKQKNTAGFVDDRTFLQPRWTGAEPIAGKTILVHSEQGLGDALQFCRYAKPLADLGARVIFEAHPALMGVLETLDGVARLVPRGGELPEFDYQCPMLSIPLALNTRLDTIPAEHRYLRADPVRTAHWSAVLGARTAPRVGLVWKASSLAKSVELAALLRHLPADFRYISLQKDIPERDRGTLDAHADILHVAPDFNDTAALCECLDLVVSVDTSVAHLSAALGRPTWILLPFIPDWRWLMDRDDSPWYPTVKLYRQIAVDDWHGILGRMREDLLACLTSGESVRCARSA